MQHDGANPAKSDQDADKPGRRNAELAKKVRANWLDGKPSAEAIDTSCWRRSARPTIPSCDEVVKLLNDGVAPSSIADAILSMAGELLMRQPGIATLHSVTSSNALHYAYMTAGDTDLRLRLLLQNAAFIPLFRNTLNNRARQVKVDDFEAKTPSGEGAACAGRNLRRCGKRSDARGVKGAGLSGKNRKCA